MQIIGSCAMTYGNPSGHASFSAAFYVTLFLITFHDRDYRSEDRPVMRSSINQRSASVVKDRAQMSNSWQRFTKSRITYVVFLILTLFMMFGIGSSRFMLGAHSID